MPHSTQTTLHDRDFTKPQDFLIVMQYARQKRPPTSQRSSAESKAQLSTKFRSRRARLRAFEKHHSQATSKPERMVTKTGSQISISSGETFTGDRLTI